MAELRFAQWFTMVDWNVVKRIALIGVALLAAFQGTGDLDALDSGWNRFTYRAALGLLWARGLLSVFEAFGWIAKIAE